jgi:hypothetical protein
MLELGLSERAQMRLEALDIYKEKKGKVKSEQIFKYIQKHIKEKYGVSWSITTVMSYCHKDFTQDIINIRKDNQKVIEWLKEAGVESSGFVNINTDAEVLK